MNRPQKTDLMITYYEENRYGISVRKKFLYFFTRWEPITTQEAENSPEVPVEFERFDEAVNFVNLIT